MHSVIVSWILTSLTITCCGATWNLAPVIPRTLKPATTQASFYTYDPSSTSTVLPQPSTSTEAGPTVDGFSHSRTDESALQTSSSTTEGLLEAGKNETHQEEMAQENWEFFESLTLVDNRYVGIVVEVKDDVEEDPALIKNLKELLGHASAALQAATESTDGRYSGLQFGEVTIIVPHHWDLEAPLLQVTGPSPAVIVSGPNPHWGHLPYTLQPGGCGEEGLYIHLTPDYIKHMNRPNTRRKLGAPGRVFLHEWVHYRWGAFDEYVDPSHNPSAFRGERPFYLDEDMQVRASVCPSTSKGWIVREVNRSSSTANPKSTQTRNDANQVSSRLGSQSLEVCTSRNNDNLPPDDCFFYPASEPAAHKSSIMGSVAEGRNANSFCDDGGAVQHNYEAPTPHNIMCGGRSVWDVMLDHNDFADRCGNRRQKRATKDSGPPKFRVRKRLYFTSIILLLECDPTWVPKLQAVRDEILVLNDTLGSASSDLKVVLVSGSNDAKIVPMNSNGVINSRSQRNLSSTFVNSTRRSREAQNLHRSEGFERTQNVWEDLQCGALHPNIESTLKAEAVTKGAMVVVFKTREGNFEDVEIKHPGRIFSLSLADGCSDKRCREEATEDLVGAFRSLIDAHPLALRRPTNKQMNNRGLNGRNRRLTAVNMDTKMRSNTRYTTLHEGLTDDDLDVQIHEMHTENKAPNDLGSVGLSHRDRQARKLSPGTTGVKKLMHLKKVLMEPSKIHHYSTVSDTVSLDRCFGNTVVVLRAARGVARFGFSISKSNVDIAPPPLTRKTYERIKVFHLPCSESYGELTFKVWMNDTQQLEKQKYSPPIQPEEVSVSFYQAVDERLAVRLSTHVFVKNADTRRCPDKVTTADTQATVINIVSAPTPITTTPEPSLQQTTSPLHHTSHTTSPPPPATGNKHDGLLTPHSQFSTTMLQPRTTLQPPTTPSTMMLEFNGTKIIMNDSLSTISFEPTVSPARDFSASLTPETKIEDLVSDQDNDIGRRHKRAVDEKRPQYNPKQIRHGSLVRIVSLLTTGAGQPVLHATVEAVVHGPHNFSAVVPLLDVGVGADTVAGDGAYSGFLTVIHGNGKHSIDVRASGGPSAIRVISYSSNYDRFWDTSDTPRPERRDTQLYDLRVECAERAQHNQLVSARFLSDSGEETHLVDLSADSAESGEGALYSGTAHILSSGKIVVPANCILVSALRGGPTAKSSSFTGRGSAIQVLPRIRNPEEQFHVKPSASFPSAAPAGSPVTKNSLGSEAEDFRIVAATADFKLAKHVEVEVVKYSPRDLTPPGRVTDLRAALVHYITPAVVLQWTAPGDDYFSGTASSLELRYHAKQSVLRREFDRATLVQEGVHVAQGTLEPLEAMVLQNVTVFLKEVSLYDLTYDQVFYFAVVLTDEMGNRGSLSNLADAHFTVEGKNQVIQATKSSNARSVATVSIMAVLFIVVLSVVGFVKIKQYARKRKLRNSNEVSLDLTSEYYQKYGTHPRNTHSGSNQGTYPRNPPKHGQRFGSLQRASPKLSNDFKV